MKRLASILILAMLAAPAGLAAQLITADELAGRRAALVERLGDVPVVVFGGTGAAGEDFQYLSGYRNTTEAALLIARESGTVRATVFADPATVLTHWDGSRWTSDPASAAGPTLERRPLDQVGSVLGPLLARAGGVHLIGATPAAEAATARVQAAVQAAPGVEIVSDGAAVVRDLRAVKSPTELELIRRAVAITTEAHRALLAHLRPGLTENEVMIVIDSVFDHLGGDEQRAFGHIVASAENSTILHHRGSDRVIRDGDQVKIDIGSAYGGYAADVTRTYPASGRYSEEQRTIYEIVRAAQQAAQEVALPGAPRADMTTQANRVLSEGLAGIGLIEAPDATYDCPQQGGGMGECPQLRLFYFHSLGHGLGLNVHDPWPSTLVPGAAFVIEPGIYVRPETFELIPDTPRNRELSARIRPAFERYRGIGVRIEDSYVVTENGVEWISPAPREAAEIEERMGASRR